jgi:hypothetical protein
MVGRFARATRVAVFLLIMAVAYPSMAFAETPAPSFGIGNPAFQDYYQKRGGLRTFGQPISREFSLLGFRVQLFQRAVLQLMPDGSATTMNLLDAGMMPYDSFNFSAVPAPDPRLIAGAPAANEPDYAARAIDFVRMNAPDEWEGKAVNFAGTFASTVRLADAFPAGNGEPSLLPLLNLEIWGLPTSKPAYDPANHDFVYQRFQRGIMHYDARTGVTQGLLLGDYFKAILIGEGLPADVEAASAGSPFLRQYDPATGTGPLRPAALPASDLAQAFLPGFGDPRYGVVVMGKNSEDPGFVASALATMGAGSWYSFVPSGEVAGKMELVRPGADMADVAERARDHPGRTWIIGNEPNVPGQDDLSPEAYSDLLAKAVGAIRGVDPTALLVGPNVLNWERTCTGCQGMTSGKEWSAAFVADYTRRYGKLPLDVWGAHVYTIDWDHLPMLDAAGDQAQLMATRKWLDGCGLRTPIWLTEFGVIWGYDGMEWQDTGTNWIMKATGRFREDLIGQYLDTIFGWLGRSGIVERWVLYATSPSKEPYASDPAGISLLKPGTVTPTALGEKYRSWASGAALR